MRRAANTATAALALALALALAWSGCTNDPFDPNSVPNEPPTIRFFVAPADPDGEIRPTSYNNRTFNWSGSDRDGSVVVYYVRIRSAPDDTAHWGTTVSTDTTMSFTTDDDGHAQAIFDLACRDDRGALSDTLVQYLPLRNFKPDVNFQADFDPLVNYQREIVHVDGAPVYTVYWNWGVMTARLFAFDLDGNETMDDFYRYTVADPLPDCVRSIDDPAADPRTCWVKAPFLDDGAVRMFEVRVKDVAPGPRELTVAVGDEADAETRFTIPWEVRAPRGRVLVVPDNYGSKINTLYRPFLDEYFGADGYDVYDFWFGFPDSPYLLLETMRKFDVVLWLGGSTVSPVLARAASRDGVLEQYLTPVDDSEPGSLLLVSRAVTAPEMPSPFRQNVLGVGSDPSPPQPLVPRPAAIGAEAVGSAAWLPTMALVGLDGGGVGMVTRAGTEVLYRFDPCQQCFGTRPPWNPIIAVRRPARASSPLARAITMSFDLEIMDPAQARAALGAILEHELEVPQP